MAVFSVNGSFGGGMPREQGFTYMSALLLILMMGTALAAVGQVWSTIGKRERELQLIWVGTQYAQALRSYYRSGTGVAQYPESLDELLEDHRFPSIQRHIRRLYPDPMTGTDNWGLTKSIDGRITGVYSRSTLTPLKVANFPTQWQEFENMTSYADWRFVAENAFQESTNNRPGAPGTPATLTAPPATGPGATLGTSLGTPIGGASQ
ncbi:type II secretion system protein [Pseudomonas putida]|jgi:type II secretory pathway pseudopilin PulG|nr:type II secretion system protein [Pseudomonas putida]MDD1964347.1 type II secretion system protein [Pseudomonas putida]